MLNAEKYKKEILEVMNNGHDFSVNEQNNKIKMCCMTNCSECLFNIRKASCSSAMTKWLLSECKEPVKLTRLEYDILKYLSDNTRHMYIARDKSGNIYLYDVEPVRSNNDDWWVGRNLHEMVAFNKLFQFVKWSDEEPTSIKEVLENCEVAQGV